RLVHPVARPWVEDAECGARAAAHERAVGVRRLAAPLEIVPQLDDLRPRGAQPRSETVVVGRELLQLSGHLGIGLHGRALSFPVAITDRGPDGCRAAPA